MCLKPRKGQLAVFTPPGFLSTIILDSANQSGDGFPWALALTFSSLKHHSIRFSSFSSVAQSCLTLCDPMNCSTPGLPVHHQLLESTQTHVHWVGDAIQPFHPLSSPSPPALNLSQHQGFFKWVSSLHQVAKVLELQLQHQSFQWIFRTNFLQDWLVWSPCSPSDSQESSSTPEFKSINSSVLSFLYSPTLTSIHSMQLATTKQLELPLKTKLTSLKLTVKMALIIFSEGRWRPSSLKFRASLFLYLLCKGALKTDITCLVTTQV